MPFYIEHCLYQSFSIFNPILRPIEGGHAEGVEALQVDGGSEFYSDFEEECERRKIRLFVLPPKSPKLNGCVERAHQTHTEEFYEVQEVPWNVTELNPELRRWENTYNCIRPHQALNYKTPLQFLKDNGIVSSDYPSNLSHI